MTRLLSLLIASFTLAGCNSASSTVSPIDSSVPGGFIAGHWILIEESDSGTTTSEEYWLPFEPGGSVGVNRLSKDGKIVFFEFLRIETNGNATHYIAHPKGRSPGTRFAMIEHSDNRVVFENPEHDFPQRIIYQCDGDTLHARIEGTQNGQPRSQSWTYRRRR